MQWKEPKNSDKYHWTRHAKAKMQQYGLSAQRIKQVIKSPIRIQEGIAGNTIAVVQPQSTKRGEDGQKTWTNEIWVMYQIKDKKGDKNNNVMDDKMAAFLDNVGQVSKQIYIISVWRYPGKTNSEDVLPDEIVGEIAEVV